ncbi:hypothetical protein DFJ63DRAFT_327195 [Scheffersomyces coipomensis]|uniref:uncharacterized protein n=1 Tax=Scheffersomyces coipomensis TaxID=1788519 RepID=UPI00315DED5A
MLTLTTQSNMNQPIEGPFGMIVVMVIITSLIVFRIVNSVLHIVYTELQDANYGIGVITANTTNNFVMCYTICSFSLCLLICYKDQYVLVPVAVMVIASAFLLVFSQRFYTCRIVH